MTRNLDIALVRSFLAVAGSGSMTQAATRLGLTQGAVSQQIRRLEETLQGALFERRRRGLTLTPRGQALLGPAGRLLALNDEIWREMTGPAVCGEVRLGMPHDLVARYLPLALDGFVLANPTIQVSLVSGASPELRDAVGEGRIDVALVEAPLGDRRGECLCVERLVWAGGRGGSAYARRPLPLSMITEACAFRAPTLEALGTAGIGWRSVFENGTTDATITTVRADLAVTVSLASVLPEDLEILGPDSGLPDLPDFAIDLHVADGGSNPAARELARHLRGAVLRDQRRSA